MSSELVDFIQLLMGVFTVVVLPVLIWFSGQAYNMSKSKDDLIKALEARNSTLFTRMEKLELEKTLFEKRASDQVKAVESRNAALSKRLDKVENEKDDIEKKASDYRDRVLSLEYDLRVMREQMMKLEDDNRKLRQRIRKMENESKSNWQVPKDDEI